MFLRSYFQNFVGCFSGLLLLLPLAVQAETAVPLAKCNAPVGELLQSAGIDLTDLTQNDPFFYTSNLEPRPEASHSNIPHLPVYYGYMNTNDTYRFVNVMEQVFTLVGDGKHGLWRTQENGMVREYRRAGAQGIAANASVFDDAVQPSMKADYSHYLEGESWSGYKLPANHIDELGQAFVDLPISHTKYQGAYDAHVPVDLAYWYCTMSSFRYPYAQKSLAFAFAQSAANKVGPLGVRAGLDVKENFPNVLRLNLFADARSWVNVGTANEVDWQAIDDGAMAAEYYLYERYFFNEKYIFIAAVFDDGKGSDLTYVRPHGAYYDHLKQRGEAVQNTRVVVEPEFKLKAGGTAKATGTHLFGVHHPDRASYNGGGACPMRGGDYADYPKVSGGSGWPTNYEEVTPLCDAVMVDIKFTVNLDGRDWSDPAKYLANAGAGALDVDYKIAPYGVYGEFIDEYHIDSGTLNSQQRNVGPSERVVFKTHEAPVGFVPVVD